MLINNNLMINISIFLFYQQSINYTTISKQDFIAQFV